MTNQQKPASAWQNAIENPFLSSLNQSGPQTSPKTYAQFQLQQSTPSQSGGASGQTSQPQNGVTHLSSNGHLPGGRTTTVEQRFTTTFSQQPTPQLANDSGIYSSTQFTAPSPSFHTQGQVQSVSQNSLLSQQTQKDAVAQGSASHPTPAVRYVTGKTISNTSAEGTKQAQAPTQTNGPTYQYSQSQQPQGVTVRQSAPRQANGDPILIQEHAYTRGAQDGVRYSGQNASQTQLQSQPRDSGVQYFLSGNAQQLSQSTQQSANAVHYQTVGYNQGSVSSLNQSSRPSLRVEHEGKVVSERLGEPRIISEQEGQKRIISTQALQAHVVKETTVTGQSKVVSEVEGQKVRMSEHRKASSQEVEVEVVKRDKIVEIIKEMPVRVERVVDVPYDVIVDVPIQRTIERERITNIVKEIPIEKIVEVPINQIIERPVEKIVEKQVEIQKFVEVPVERVVERPYEVIRENITWQDRFVDIDEGELGKYPQFDRLPTDVRYEEVAKAIDQPRYVENIVEQVRPVERQRLIEVPREKIIENRQQVIIDRPRQVDKVIHREVEVPVERTVYKDVQVNVEVPRYRENLIEIPVPVERIVEREIQVPVDRVVEKKVIVEQLVENPVEHIVEIPVPHEEIIEEVVEQITEEPYEVQQAQIRPQEKIIRRSTGHVRRVEVPVEYPIERLVSKQVPSTIQKKVNRYTESRVESTLECPVVIERVTEVPKIVERIIEVPVERIREQIKFVEKIIEKPVYIDTVIDKFVEVIVERVVEVPVEKIVEVEIEIVTEVPQIEEINLQEDVVVEGVHEDYQEAPVEETRNDFEDEVMAQQIKLRQLELDSLARKNKELVAELGGAQQEINRLAANISNEDERENFLLLAKFAELNSRYRMEVEHNEGLRVRQAKAVRMVDWVVQKNPVVERLKEKVLGLVGRNQQLVTQLRTSSENELKKVRYSQYRA